MGYVVAYSQALVADENAYDEFCDNMYNKHLSNQYRGNFVSLDDAVKEFELSI